MVAEMSGEYATYKVVYDRDESGWWLARVPSVPGCHTQGRTVDEARRRIREALGLFVDDAGKTRLVDAVRIPASAKQAVRRYWSIRKRAAAEEKKASAAVRQAVRALHSSPLKLSMRDAATVLGVSYQRVQQLSAESAWRRDRAEDRGRKAPSR
jgi:predicted RNase H-like HicB family nuclease